MARILILNQISKPIKDKYGIGLNATTINIIIQALNQHLIKFCNIWSLTVPEIIQITANYKVQPSDWVFRLIDQDSSAPGALAFHSVNPQGQIYGEVLIDTILQNNGVILYDPSFGTGSYKNTTIATVSSALSHEILETLADPNACGLWQAYNGVQSLTGQSPGPTFGDGSVLVASEVCDPVENNGVSYLIGKQWVALSDFIYPSWWNISLTTGIFNFTKTLKAPFTIDEGGYAVCLDNTGNANFIYGAKFQEWKKPIKEQSHRHDNRRKKN